MLFELRIYETDHPMLKKGLWIEDFSKKYLENTFKVKEYGQDVLNIVIVFILIRNIPGYEDWDKPRRPKYIEHLEFSNVATGDPLIWDKRFVIEIRFGNDVYDEFMLADDEQSKKIIARESLKALDLLDKIPKRLKDFDKERFRADVADYYRYKGWI